MNPTVPGTFENERENVGYLLEFDHQDYGCFWREKVVYRFILIERSPITFIQRDGTRIRPCREFLSDQGSQPPIVQGWLPKDRHPAVYFHDDQYRSGGAWIAAPGNVAFEFVPLTRSQADALLRTMLRCGTHPVGAAKAWAYWVGVRVGGWAAFHPWRPGRAGTDQLFEPAEKPDVDDAEPIGI
jgi:hypothetical protein